MGQNRATEIKYHILFDQAMTTNQPKRKVIPSIENILFSNQE